MNISQNHSNTPFIRKLNHILTEPTYAHIITWDSTGTMIDILDQKRIQSQILPKFFRHTKFESFIRQLNLYGFKKIKKTDCHRFKHVDLMKGNCLFSIKSQRKLKNIIENRNVNHSHDEITQQKVEKLRKQQNQIKPKQIIQKPQENQLYLFNSKMIYGNSENIQRMYENMCNLYQMNQYQQSYFIPTIANQGNYQIQNHFFPSYNNIFFYN